MLKLHSFYRSSAAYRVRIALELKNLNWESIPVNLGIGEQSLETFLKYNPKKIYAIEPSDIGIKKISNYFKEDKKIEIYMKNISLTLKKWTTQDPTGKFS